MKPFAISAWRRHLGQPWTIELAAAYLNLAVGTVQRLAHTGQIPCARIGRSYRFMQEQLDAWLLQGGDAPQLVAPKSHEGGSPLLQSPISNLKLRAAQRGSGH